MQKEQRATNERGAFTSLQKGRALLILLDYSDRTGKKWSGICSEIMSLVGGAATLEAPLLTRQDLEAWASGRSQLGDEKFAFVFGFLTHPQTLQRKEFSKANSILIEDRLKAYTRILGELVGGSSLTPVHSENGVPEKDKCLSPEDIEGVFVLRRDDRYELLYLSYEASIEAYLCHLFSSPQKYAEGWLASAENAKFHADYDARESGQEPNFDTRDFLGKTDWSIVRYSGLAVFGNPVRVFLRSLEQKKPREFSIYASLTKAQYSFRQSSFASLWLVDQTISSKVAEQIARSDEVHNGYLEFLMLDASKYVQGMRWRQLDGITDMFEDIRWNVGL